MPSFAFQRRQCLQSFHAFKRRQCLHLHFEDDNVFSHCMLSKGNNVFIYISKTTMSSVIACFQKVKMSSFTFRRRQCIQSLHAFKRRQSHCMLSKGDNDPHLYFEDDNVFISKASMSLVLVLHRSRCPLFLCFKKKENKKIDI